MNHILSCQSIPTEVLPLLLSKARATKHFPRQPLLPNHCLALFFDKPSARTRYSFHSAMRYLGGDSIPITRSEIGFPERESLSDTARLISLFYDAIVIRIADHAVLENFAKAASIPVINGLTPSYHPCQALADILTILEYTKEGRHVCWIGDFNNVCVSLIELAGKLAIPVTISCPRSVLPEGDLNELAGAAPGTITWEEDPRSAVRNKQVVYTDTWVSLGEDEKEKVDLSPWQVNGDLMKHAHQEAIFMHCLPAKREKEVTSEVLDGGQSRVWEQAYHRQSAQIALLAWCWDSLELLKDAE